MHFFRPNRTELSLENLQRYGTLMQTQPAATTSDKYRLIRTIDVAESLMIQGWQPMGVQENRVRKEGFKDFQRHEIVFHPKGLDLGLPDTMKVGQIIPELRLINGHDGKTGYRLIAGIYRLKCKNGLVVAAGSLETISFRHMGDVSQITEASLEMAEKYPTIFGRVFEFSGRMMSDDERFKFAADALALRWENKEDAPIANPSTLLLPTRASDGGTDLWTTYNVVQENLVYGGVVGDYNPETHRRKSFRSVRSINGDLKLNTGLWKLMESYMQN